jgi:hypothetical protein
VSGNAHLYLSKNEDGEGEVALPTHLTLADSDVDHHLAKAVRLGDERDVTRCEETLSEVKPEVLDMIVTPDVETRCHCLQLRHDLSSNWSQWEQDTFVWYNYLRHLGNKGTYVDVGIYNSEILSNTVFLDMCLGWEGLCIEMNPSHRPIFAKSQHTCKFISSCVSDGYIQAKMYNYGGFGGGETLHPDFHVPNPTDAPAVSCRPLASILKEHKMFHVDFLSLDIEGEEILAFKTFPFDEISVETLLIESVHQKDWALNYLMTMNGYQLEQQLAIDPFFVRNNSTLHNLPMPKAPPFIRESGR